MNNVKLSFRSGATFFQRKPKHTPQERRNIHGLKAEDLKKRSRNRKATKLARLARRETRHGR